MNKLQRLTRPSSPARAPLVSDIKFVSDTNARLNKVTVKFVTTLKSSKNEINHVEDPLARFKKKPAITGSLLAAAAVLGYLFKDKIFSGLDAISEFLVVPFKTIKQIPERITNTFDTVTESIKETITIFKSPLEHIKAPADKLKALTAEDIIASIGAGLGLSDESLEKLISLGSKVKAAVSGIFGGLISNPFNIFTDIVTGKFSFSVAKWLFEKSRGVLNSVISAGKSSAAETQYMNAQYADDKFEPLKMSVPLVKKASSTSDTESQEDTNARIAPDAPDSSEMSSASEPIADGSLSPGSTAGAMTPVTDEMIRAATIYESKGRWTSKDQWLRTFIAIESMGKATADNGTFEGLFQLNRNYAMFNKGNRYNPHDNLRMAKAFWFSDCIPALRKAGLPVTVVTLYMTHQQGPAGGVRILKNWKAGNNVMTGSKTSRTGNGGKKSNGAPMNDREFTEFWIQESMRREARLNSNTGGGKGGTSSVINKPVSVRKIDDPIPTVEVSKLPNSLANFKDISSSNQTKEHIAFKIQEPNQAFNIAGTTEYSETADILVPVRLNSPNILKMTLSTRML